MLGEMENYVKNYHICTARGIWTIVVRWVVLFFGGIFLIFFLFRWVFF